MNTKTIKVIKRSERNRHEEATATVDTAAKKSAQEAARDVVSTVTGWVSEFQQKRRAETAQAIKTLFSDTTPQASKA